MAFGIIQYGESASNGADSPDRLYKVFAQISSNKYWQARTSSRPCSALRVLRRIRSNRSCAFDQDLRSPIIVYNSSQGLALAPVARKEPTETIHIAKYPLAVIHLAA